MFKKKGDFYSRISVKINVKMMYIDFKGCAFYMLYIRHIFNVVCNMRFKFNVHKAL